jgi:hypothetical protein
MKNVGDTSNPERKLYINSGTLYAREEVYIFLNPYSVFSIDHKKAWLKEE